MTKRATINDLTAPANEAKSFDTWFFSQTKKQQDKMRESGVMPYRDMIQSRHVFSIDPNHKAWATNDEPKMRTEVDAFISRDHVGVMLKGFLDAISHTGNFGFRRHVEMIRWALSLPGCLDSRTIGRMFGRSHFWTRKRAQEIRAAVHGDAAGMYPHPPHVNSRRDKHRNAA